MRINRFSALFLTVLLISCTITSYAASFTDVSDDYWAKDYIEEMSGIGLIKGYPDGTFQPSNAVSKWECLLLAARVLGFNDDENSEIVQLASKNYISSLDQYDVTNKEEIAYLMYWGVLDSSDLSAYLSDENKNKPEVRHEAATLLTKVMGGEQEALNQMLVDSNYSDANQIPPSAKPFVAYATEKKLMQGTGDNKFEPLLEVSRAQMATMMFNTLRAMNFSISDVTIQSTVASNQSINVIAEDGTSAKYTLSNNTLIRLDGKSSDLDALSQGMSVRIYLQEGNVRMIEGITSSDVLSAEGQVVDEGTNASGDYITIGVADEDGNIKNRTYIVAASTTITLDGARVYLSQTKNQYAKVYYNGNEIAYKIEAQLKSTSVNGTLEKLIMDPPSLILNMNNGGQQTFYFMDKVSVTRNDLAAEVRDLAVGDRLDMTLEYNKVKSIRAKSINDSVEGIIKAINFADKTTLDVKIGNDVVTYNITPSTQVYVDNQLSNVYQLRVNANAKLYVESNNITKIYSNAVVGPSQVTGTVKNVNVNYSIITLDETGTGTEQQVAVKKNCVIVDQTGSNITTLSKITTGRTIVCFGVMNSGVYEVNTIIITN